MSHPIDLVPTRRTFVRTGLRGAALAGLHCCCGLPCRPAGAVGEEAPGGVESVVREPTLFAGIRKPIANRAELEPSLRALKKACGKRIAGPPTLIFRFDTPVDGYDAEIGFPVHEAVNQGEVTTHTLREMHFFSALHEGSADERRTAVGGVYQYMSSKGLSPELELVEVYHRGTPWMEDGLQVQVMASYLDWPGVYRTQLVRVLGEKPAAAVWAGGDRLTPHTPVDPRCAWAGRSIGRLQRVASIDQQYDILSRVALVRPREDIAAYKAVYEASGDITTVFEAQQAQLATTPTGGFVDPPTFDGKTLHLSKVPRNGKAYRAATTHTEKRKAYCFCALVREAADPTIDPVFCYRAAGWARQFWEPILGVELNRCTITHSILAGDDFCAWDYHLEA